MTELGLTFADFYTSVTTLRFRFMMGSFVLTYLASFVFFAGLWGLLAWSASPHPPPPNPKPIFGPSGQLLMHM